jgi:hypothetical protein
MKIALDVDGTVVFHEYPYLGESIPNCTKVLKRIIKSGHEIIILTMREGRLLDEAVEWFKNNEIEFKYLNSNPDFETGSRKVYANYYIDDHGIGIPLIYNPEIHQKPFVDWLAIEKILEERGLIHDKSSSRSAHNS